MPRDLSEKLSANFSLGELVASDTAEREAELREAQASPSDEVVAALRHLCTSTLQPLRTSLRHPIYINSGYRSPILTDRGGGSLRSQHVVGQAADCRLSAKFMSDPETEDTRARIAAGVEARVGEGIRPDVNQNYFLFAYICLRLDELDIDQVIHEYGQGPGCPAWVHVSASTARNKREIVRLGSDVARDLRKPTLEEALRLGTAPSAG